MTLKNHRCLLVTDGLLYTIGQYQSGWFTKNTFVLFAREVARLFNGFTMFAPIRQVETTAGLDGLFKLLPETSFRVEKAGDFNSVLQFYKRLPILYTKNRNSIKKLLNEHDVALLRLPSMNAIFFARLFAESKKPYCTYVVGDQEKIVTGGGKYDGIQFVSASLVAAYHSAKIRFLVKKSRRSIFLGNELLKKYGKKCANSKIMFTSLVREEDIVYRNNRLSRSDPLRIIFAGRLEHEKGVDTLLSAIRSLLDRGLDITLTICGTGTAEAKLKAEAQRLGVNDYIEFLGFVKLHPDLDRLFQASDIFVLPSFSEGIPKVLLEAMAKGVPIVATSVGGVPEVVTHGDNGLLVPPKNHTAIADAVQNILENHHLKNRLVSSGYNFIRERTMESQAAHLASLLKEVV